MTPDKPGWRPIAEAPRDGTRVLVYEPRADGWAIMTDWFANDPLTKSYGWLGDPTHWMPLPPAPDSADG